MNKEITLKFNGRVAALLVAATVFLASVAVAVTRTQHGSPDSPVPQAAAALNAADTLTTLERNAKDNPRDIPAWAALGQAYFNATRYLDAVGAYVHATQIDQAPAAVWSALGEARVMASPREPMPAEAAEDFTRALALDAHDPRARYFAAVRRDLTGDHTGAIADWLALLAETPSGASWEAGLRRTISQVGKINHIAVDDRLARVRQPAPSAAPELAPSGGIVGQSAPGSIPGPTPEQLRAASSIPPSQQDAMAHDMVAQLQARLQSQPQDLDGWVMMMRSRMMLNQPDQASAALASAVAANPASARDLREQAAALGVH